MSPSGLTVTPLAVAGNRGQIGLQEPHGAALEMRQAESESNSCAKGRTLFSVDRASLQGTEGMLSIGGGGGQGMT